MIFTEASICSIVRFGQPNKSSVVGSRSRGGGCGGSSVCSCIGLADIDWTLEILNEFS